MIDGPLAALMWPALFFGGAGAVAAPILIHLLARRRFRRIRWAAVDFLLRAEKRNRRRVRLEQLILLALRCLIVLLFALLIARPFLRPHGLAALLGGARHMERIIILDDSFSMGYTGAGSAPFQRAKERARRLVDWIRQAGAGGDTVTLLKTSAIDSPIVAGAYLDDTQTDGMLSNLEALALSERRNELFAAFEKVGERLDADPAILNAAVYLISDFQTVDWKASDDADSGSDSPVAPLADWAGDDHHLKLVLVDVGYDAASNTAVTDLTARQASFVAGIEGRVRVTTANFSDREMNRVELLHAVGTATPASTVLATALPWDRTTLPLDTVFPRAGYQSLRVELPEDDLPIDNARTVVVEVRDAVPILIVNGEPSTDDYDDEVALLRTALRPEGEVFSGNELRIIDETELEAVELSRYALVILANVFRVSEAAADHLHEFAEAGGGVIFFLGDQVDAAQYNSVLYRHGNGLLPAKVGQTRSAPPDGVALEVPDRDHPLLRGLTGPDRPLGLDRVRFYQYWSLQAGARSADGLPPEADERPPARIIARFRDQAGTPAIVERSYGAGRVLLLATTCDTEWNDWPKTPSFVITALQSVSYAAMRGAVDADRLVGTPIDLPLDPEIYEPVARLRTPSYPGEQEVELSAEPGGNGADLHLRWARTDHSGVYQFLLQRRRGGEVVRPVAVNPDPAESDLRRITETELRRRISELPFEYIGPTQDLAAVDDQARQELWPAVLVAGVVLLMLEQAVAWLFGRRS